MAPAATSRGRPCRTPTARRRRDPLPGARARRYSTAARAAGSADGVVHFTTKGDNQVWALRPARPRRSPSSTTRHLRPVLTGVDNVTVDAVGRRLRGRGRRRHAGRDRCGATARSSPFLQVLGQDDSEITGPAFTPAGDRLYFSSQRGRHARPASRTRSPARSARNAAVASTMWVLHTGTEAHGTTDLQDHRPSAARGCGLGTAAQGDLLLPGTTGGVTCTAMCISTGCCRCRQRARCRTRPPLRSSPGHTTRSRASGRRAARRCRPRGCSPIPAVPRPSRTCWPPTRTCR